MANTAIFSSRAHQAPHSTDCDNEAGGRAYAFTPEQALAQYAVTGCFNQTFYSSAEQQLEQVIDWSLSVSPAYLARTAVYARQHGHMKDMPALLLAILSILSVEDMRKAFPHVIDSGKMLRNFVQILRSGVLGRRSLGSAPKRLVQDWLNQASDAQLLAASIGQSPSLADVLRMVHPKPASPEREALFAWILGKPHDCARLPQAVQQLIRYRSGQSHEVPNVPFMLLSSHPLSEKQWGDIARQASWQVTRMNLNTFLRHGVFKQRDMARIIAKKLACPRQIRQARALPYQLMAAHRMAQPQLPDVVRQALHTATDIALKNLPELQGKIYVLIDVSASMFWPITGARQGSSSAMRCIDIAALMAAAVQHKARDAGVLPFDTRCYQVHLSRRKSVLHNAEQLSRYGGGGTDCSAPLRELNRREAQADLVIFVSDNQSWYGSRHETTDTMQQWNRFRQRNPKARLVCLDIQPFAHSQAHAREEILNIGGFSDIVFSVIARFAEGKIHGQYWQRMIESMQL